MALLTSQSFSGEVINPNHSPELQLMSNCLPDIATCLSNNHLNET